MKDDVEPRCYWCGQFLDMKASHYGFIPDTHVNVEQLDIICKQCWDSRLAYQPDKARPYPHGGEAL